MIATTSGLNMGLRIYCCIRYYDHFYVKMYSDFDSGISKQNTVLECSPTTCPYAKLLLLDRAQVLGKSMRRLTITVGPNSNLTLK